VRAGRDAAKAAAKLDALRRDAIEDRNLVPAMLECVRAEVSLGEISNALREIYGEHRDSQSS
jgi:methylmalonyl-CoA mutase N-terminal domain/subunit